MPADWLFVSFDIVRGLRICACEPQVELKHTCHHSIPGGRDGLCLGGFDLQDVVTRENEGFWWSAQASVTSAVVSKIVRRNHYDSFVHRVVEMSLGTNELRLLR